MNNCSSARKVIDIIDSQSYEVVTNSIVIQMDKRYGHQWHRLARKVTFDDFCHLRSNQFEGIMVRFLKDMAQELEYQIKVAPEPMKGEEQ